MVHSRNQEKNWRRLILKTTIAKTTYGIWRVVNDKNFSQKPIDNNLKENLIHNIDIISTLHRKLNNHVNATTLSIV